VTNPTMRSGTDLSTGQNSINKVEAAGGQRRLAAYCASKSLTSIPRFTTYKSRLRLYVSDTPVNVIPLAFLNGIKNPTLVNFANAGDNCTAFAGTQLLSCSQIEFVSLCP
jgi:chitinase